MVEVIPYTSGCAYNQVPFSLNFQNWNIDIISTERVKIANSLLYHVKKKVVFLFEKKKYVLLEKAFTKTRAKTHNRQNSDMSVIG